MGRRRCRDDAEDVKVIATTGPYLALDIKKERSFNHLERVRNKNDYGPLDVRERRAKSLKKSYMRVEEA